MKRGQSAVEFVVLATMMFLFFSLTFIYLESLLVDYTEGAKQAGVTAVQQAVVKELALADKVPAGTVYTRQFNLPGTIQGIPYDISVENETAPLKDAVVVTLQGTSAVIYVDQDINGTLHPGTNKLVKTTSIVLN